MGTCGHADMRTWGPRFWSLCPLVTLSPCPLVSSQHRTLMQKLKVLFLCTGNSCRSQMAEGWAKALKGDVIEPYSAGTQPHGMNQTAIAVMAEAGVDISGHHSKHVDDLAGVDFDYIVTVCDDANEACAVFPGKAKRIHVGF